MKLLNANSLMTTVSDYSSLYKDAVGARYLANQINSFPQLPTLNIKTYANLITPGGLISLQDALATSGNITLDNWLAAAVRPYFVGEFGFTAASLFRMETQGARYIFDYLDGSVFWPAQSAPLFIVPFINKINSDANPINEVVSIEGSFIDINLI